MSSSMTPMRADARRRQIEQQRRAQAAGADHEHASTAAARLPLLAHFVEDQVARIAFELGIA